MFAADPLSTEPAASVDCECNIIVSMPVDHTVRVLFNIKRSPRSAGKTIADTSSCPNVLPSSQQINRQRRAADEYWDTRRTHDSISSSACVKRASGRDSTVVTRTSQQAESTKWMDSVLRNVFTVTIKLLNALRTLITSKISKTAMTINRISIIDNHHRSSCNRWRFFFVFNIYVYSPRR